MTLFRRKASPVQTPATQLAAPDVTSSTQNRPVFGSGIPIDTTPEDYGNHIDRSEKTLYHVSMKPRF